MIYRGQGNVAQVDITAGVSRCHAAAVQQAQRVLAADCAQVGGTDTPASTSDAIGCVEVALHCGYGLDQIGGIGDSGAVYRFRVKNLDRQRLG